MKTATTLPQQNVLLLQGGGALGAYQAGVFEALERSGLELDWVVGTSIGAINAAIIAGNPPHRRLEHLFEFWARMGQNGSASSAQSDCDDDPCAGLATRWNALVTMLFGLPGFFRPRWTSPFRLGLAAPAAQAGLYDTSELQANLLELVDFDYLAASPVRLTVGAVDVESCEIRYFDSRDMAIRVEHVLASGALPPAFAPVEIDGRRYWDGGLHSNSPIERVLRDNPRRHSLCFLATLWPTDGKTPDTLADVLLRAKEIQYASRVDTLVGLEQELHRLRHFLLLLGQRLPEAERSRAEVSGLLGFGCRSVYHLVRLQAPRLPDEDQHKDIDFAAPRISQRWSAGCHDALRALADRRWMEAVAPDQGIVVHDYRGGTDGAGPTARKAPTSGPAAPSLSGLRTDPEWEARALPGAERERRARPTQGETR